MMSHKEIIFVSIIMLLFPSVYAQVETDPRADYYHQCGYEKFDCYQETGFRLTSNPVICMNTPSDRSLTVKMHGYTVAAVAEWNSMLNSVGTLRHPIWNMQLIPTASDICNITIDYVAKPSAEEQASITDAVGVTWWNFDTHQAKIQIFYDDIKFENHAVFCAEYGNGTIICDPTIPQNIAIGVKNNYVPHYADELAPDYQMQWAIRHELGHAFGLGHYILSPNEWDLWEAGEYYAPSIVLKDTGYETYQSAITDLDIAQLKSLYSNNGFSRPNLLPQETTTSSQPTTQPTQTDILQHYKNIIKTEVTNYKAFNYVSDVANVANALNEANLTSIQVPDYPVGVSMPSWVWNNLGWWANAEISDNDLASAIQYLYNNGLFYFS